MLTTSRLILRPISVADAPFVRDLLNDPGWMANVDDRGVRTVADAERYIMERFAASWARNGFGFLLVAREGEAVGVCGFVRREGLDAPDLGFAFLAPHTRRGYGLEAGAAMLCRGRAAYGMSRILAITKPDNQASAALLVRLGFAEREGVQLPGIGGPSRLFENDTAAAISF